MRYDPRDHGALCDECPLGPRGALRKEDWEPVGPEIHADADVLAVAESPGPEEVIHGRPLVGRSGNEWNHALTSCGKKRTDIDLDTVISCKPPGQASGAWRRLDKSLDKLNKQRAKDGEEPMPHPAVCCRPRLLQTAQGYRRIISLGKTATASLTGLGGSIHSTRGGPLRVDDTWSVVGEDGTRRMLPTLHPDFIIRSPGWRHVLHSDMSKAFRWFDDNLQWEEPDILWRPTPAELKEWLAESAPFFTYDVETDGIEPLTCQLRTLAIATPDLDAQGRSARDGCVDKLSRAVAIGFLSVDGSTRFYSMADERQLKDILCEAFTDGRVWVGHNAGYYDRMVIEHHFDVTPKPLVDTLFPARFRAPDLPKGLKTIGSILTDVERWETTEKGTKISTGSEDDDELLRYNIIDTVVNARITVPLIDAATEAGAFRPLPDSLKPGAWSTEQPWNLNEVDHTTQDMCVEMHKNGVWVDQPLRSRLEAEYQISVDKRFKRLTQLARDAGAGKLNETQAAADDDMNPGSAAQVRTLLYDGWNLGMPAQMDVKDFYTESGLPSTGDAVLRAHLASGLLTDEQSAFVRELRLYRREKNKILGTVLIPMRLKADDLKKGLVWSDGRVRSTWNAHVTSVGRLSSSGPNLQNIGNRKGQGRLKGIFSAAPGHILIGADLDQAHLRIAANYWKIPLLLECFDEGKDPHNTLAYSAFGDRFKTAGGWGLDGFSLYNKPEGGAAKAMRDVSKTLRYASIYGANPATVWQVITSTETDDGELPYIGMTLREVRVMHDAWLESEPQWGEAWEQMMIKYGRQGWMEEPIMYRRSGPLSDGKLNEVVNFPVLAAEGAVMRLAEIAVRDAFPFQKWGPGTGMIHQCHDSIAVEVPEHLGEEMVEVLEKCMTVTIPGWDVSMTAEAELGRTLKDI